MGKSLHLNLGIFNLSEQRARADIFERRNWLNLLAEITYHIPLKTS